MTRVWNDSRKSTCSLRSVRSSVVPGGATILSKTIIAQSVLLLLTNLALVKVQLVLLTRAGHHASEIIGAGAAAAATRWSKVAAKPRRVDRWTIMNVMTTELYKKQIDTRWRMTQLKRIADQLNLYCIPHSAGTQFGLSQDSVWCRCYLHS